MKNGFENTEATTWGDAHMGAFTFGVGLPSTLGDGIANYPSQSHFTFSLYVAKRPVPPQFRHCYSAENSTGDDNTVWAKVHYGVLTV